MEHNIRNLKTKIKENKAITLVALMVTIIILLILAGISIAQLTGNGLFDKAKTAKEEYKNSTDEENRKLEEMYSQLLIANSDGSTLANVDMTTLKRLILDTTYPVGSIFLSIDGTDPSTTLGGTWERISEGRTLFGAGELNGITYTAGNTVNAGLPNIEGRFGGHTIPNYEELSVYSDSALYAYSHGSGWGGCQNQGYNRYAVGFDASRSNAIYGGSATVQPNAYVTYMWKRTE